MGGYNIAPLVGLLDDDALGASAAQQLKHTLLVFDAFYDVEAKAKAGNANAKAVMQVTILLLFANHTQRCFNFRIFPALSSAKKHA